MPVRFKGDSEYHEHYKWLESPKSASFSPTKQQAADVAGLSSPQVSLTNGFMAEPPLQRKMKPIPLVTTSTTKMFDEDIVVPDDYMLLGSQEKFSANVPYKDYLTKNRTRVLGTTFVAPTKPVDFEAAQRKPDKPLAKIDFDTGAPMRREPKKQAPQLHDVEVTGTSKPLNPSKTRVISKEPASPVTPQKSATSYPSKVPMGKTTAIAKPVKSQEEPAQSRAGQIVGKERLSQPELPSQKRSDEFKRVIARQDDSVDDQYVMKYRAGLSPPRKTNPKRKSEYNNKFDWKNPVESTPILAAEQVIHNNNPQVAPYKVGPPKKSEYAKEFKVWKYKPILSKDDTAAERQRGLKRNLRPSQMRRTRSLQDITPDRLPAAGSPSKINHDNSRLTQSLNPQRPFFPHRRTVSWTTEYKSNFQSFNNYQYDKGAWKGAAPPHVRQQMQAYEQQPAAVKDSNWRSEVKELRDKAEEYRKRSNGTHFSRTHVAQLLSDNSKLWDVVSVNSDLSALDLEQSQVTNSPPQAKERVMKGSRQRTQSAQPGNRAAATKQKVNESVQVGGVRNQGGTRHRLAWSSDGGRSTSPSDSARSIRSGSSNTVTTVASAGSYQPTKRQQPSKPRQRATGSVSSRSDISTIENGSMSTEDGRAQTPEMTNEEIVRRHHLDVTTPNRHGLLLASPPHRHDASFTQTTPPKQAAVQPTTMKSSEKRPSVAKRSMPLTVNTAAKMPTNAPQLLSPTYGKPTPDTHPLLDQELEEPIDVILETRYVQSPQPRHKGKALFSAEKGMTSLIEGAGMTYKVQAIAEDPWKHVRAARQRDDDETSQLSASMMSVMSSTSSLASEVLERAARRQKEFWGKPKA